MKKILLAMCMSMALILMMTPAYAFEIWSAHLPGVNEGLAAGALPPPGFYFIMSEWNATDYKLYNNQGSRQAQDKDFSLAENPALLWVTPWRFLGASYGVLLLQPFDYSIVRLGTSNLSPGTAGPHGLVDTGTGWGTYNTLIVPGILSWHVPYNFRVKFALDIWVNDAWTSPADSLGAEYGTGSAPWKLMGKEAGHNVTETNGVGSWIIVPNLGISWLYHGWNISADTFYGFPLKDHSLDYQSGQILEIDWTATHTWHKWTFGVGAFTGWQLQLDKFRAWSGPPPYTVPRRDANLYLGPYKSQEGTRLVKYQVGPILGYNFGPCSLMAWYNWSVYDQNDLGGETFEVRLVVPLGNPYPFGPKA